MKSWGNRFLDVIAFANMRKYFVAAAVALVFSCTQEQKYKQAVEKENACISKDLSNQQKTDNNLFLKFYYGMTPKEFNQTQQELLKSGQLIQYDSTGALPHPDSTVKFMLIIDNKGPEKCFFTIKPDFEGCVLHAVNLGYIPSFGSTAYFKESGKSQEVPDLTTANAIEKAYRKKYGNPSTKSEYFLGGYNQYIWKSGAKETDLYKIFGTTQDMKGNDFRQISGIGITYRSIAFDKKEKQKLDSANTADKRRLMKLKEIQEKSI